MKRSSEVPSVRWSAGGTGGLEAVEFRVDAGERVVSEQEHGRI